MTVLAKNGQGAVNEVDCMGDRRDRTKCALAAAACAEYLNEHHKHRLDCDEHAILTEKLYDDIIERQLLNKSFDDLPLA